MEQDAGLLRLLRLEEHGVRREEGGEPE